MWYRRHKLVERIKAVMRTTTYTFQHFKHIEPAGELETLEEFLHTALEDEHFAFVRIAFQGKGDDKILCYSEEDFAHERSQVLYKITVKMFGVEDI